VKIEGMTSAQPFIVIVGMLIVISVVAAAVWDLRAIVAAAIAWACLPLSHLLKHVLGLPDTIHPNTYASILELAAFSFVVTGIGLGMGLAFRRILSRHAAGNL
jgi:hypothetical protein